MNFIYIEKNIEFYLYRKNIELSLLMRRRIEYILKHNFLNSSCNAMPMDEIAISSSSKAKSLINVQIPCHQAPTNQLNYISEINQNSCDQTF